MICTTMSTLFELSLNGKSRPEARSTTLKINIKPSDSKFHYSNRKECPRGSRIRGFTDGFALYGWLCLEDVTLDLVAKGQPDGSSMILRSHCPRSHRVPLVPGNPQGSMAFVGESWCDLSSSIPLNPITGMFNYRRPVTIITGSFGLWSTFRNREKSTLEHWYPSLSREIRNFWR